jgi:hypothetical protein
MKNTAIALTPRKSVLTGTPVLAATAPSSDKVPGVTPNYVHMPLRGFGSYYAPYYGRTSPKWTGAFDPYTPNPHRNTTGAEAKD